MPNPTIPTRRPTSDAYPSPEGALLQLLRQRFSTRSIFPPAEGTLFSTCTASAHLAEGAGSLPIRSFRSVIVPRHTPWSSPDGYIAAVYCCLLLRLACLPIAAYLRGCYQASLMFDAPAPAVVPLTDPPLQRLASGFRHRLKPASRQTYGNLAGTRRSIGTDSPCRFRSLAS